MSFQIEHGEALDVLRGMADCSVDAVVTDPPAGISFMSKAWDSDKGGRDAWITWMAEIAAEVLRVVKPGAHALVWSLPRTSHWTATAWENAGFEVRERVAHVFGSGFPKSLDIGKAIDRAAGIEREVIGRKTGRSGTPVNDIRGGRIINGISGTYDSGDITAPACAAAQQWDGWGTALKPAVEDWWLLRKPLSEATIAANVVKSGVGGINVDGCRIAGDEDGSRNRPPSRLGSSTSYAQDEWTRTTIVQRQDTTGKGRFPANLIHDGSAEVIELFPVTTSGGRQGGGQTIGLRGNTWDHPCHNPIDGDTGSAARFFYCAKPSRAEREVGLDGMPEDDRHLENYRLVKANPSRKDGGANETKASRNNHPCVKSIALMRYLCRLITPPNGTVLDPFFGSGSTGCAAIAEGFSIIGIEREVEYVEIARRRCEHAEKQKIEDQRQIDLPLFAEIDHVQY